MMRQRNHYTWRLCISLAVFLVLAACAADTEVLQENPPQLPDADRKTLDSSEIEMGFERGAPSLKATDPGSFVRAAGKPQLVELFAFW